MLDVSGPPQRTGKARGTDLLDGTVTLPLILAAERDPGIRSADLRSLDAAGAEALCDRIEASGALRQVRSRALEMVAEGKRRLGSAGFDAERRKLLRPGRRRRRPEVQLRPSRKSSAVIRSAASAVEKVSAISRMLSRSSSWS